MTVHWHDDEHAWCPCDEVTTANPNLVAAWFRTIRHPELKANSADSGETADGGVAA